MVDGVVVVSVVVAIVFVGVVIAAVVIAVVVLAAAGDDGAVKCRPGLVDAVAAVVAAVMVNEAGKEWDCQWHVECWAEHPKQRRLRGDQ